MSSSCVVLLTDFDSIRLGFELRQCQQTAESESIIQKKDAKIKRAKREQITHEKKTSLSNKYTTKRTIIFDRIKSSRITYNA